MSVFPLLASRNVALGSWSEYLVCSYSLSHYAYWLITYSLQCITHGQLRHVQGELWLLYLPCLGLVGPSLGQCLMQMLSSKSLEKVFVFRLDA